MNNLLLDKEYTLLMDKLSKIIKEYYSISKDNFQEVKSLFSLIEEIINLIILQNSNLIQNTELEKQLHLTTNGLKSAFYSNKENLITFFNDATIIFKKLSQKKEIFMQNFGNNTQIVWTQPNENINPKNRKRMTRTPSMGERQFRRMRLDEKNNLISRVQQLFSNFDTFEEILGNISNEYRNDFSLLKNKTMQIIIKEIIILQNVIKNYNFSLLNEKKLINKMIKERENSYLWNSNASEYNTNNVNPSSINIKNLYDYDIQNMEKLIQQNKIYKFKNAENDIKMNQMKKELSEYQNKLIFAEKKIENYTKIIQKNKNIMNVLFQKNKMLNNQNNQIIINNENNGKNFGNNCKNLIEKINNLSKDNLLYKNENKKLKLIINRQRNLRRNLSFNNSNDLISNNTNIKTENTSSQFYDAKLKSAEKDFLTKEKEYKNEITYLTNNNMSLTKNLSITKKNILNLQKDYTEKTKELEKLKNQNNNFNNLVKQLRDSVDKTNKINTEYKNKINILESDIEKIKNDDKQKEELNKLKESYEKIKNLYESTITENKKLTEESQQKEKEFSLKLDNEKEKNLLKISEKENEYISKLKEIQNANTELSNDITLKENVIQQKDEIIKNLKKKYVNNEEENLKKLKEKNDLLSADVDEYVLKIEENRAIIESQKQDIEGLKNYITKLQNENEKLIIKESSRVDTNNSLNNNDENLRLEKENKKLREQIEHISSELPREIEELKSENSSLKKQILICKNINSYSDINSEPIRNRSDLISKNILGEEGNNNLKTKCDILTNENEKLKKQLKNMMKKSIVYMKSNSKDEAKSK